MASIKYDSKGSKLVIFGLEIKGIADGNVTISRDTDQTTVHKGRDGENAYSVSNDKSGTISVDLLYGTEYDTYLENLATYGGFFPIGFFHEESNKILQTYGMVMSVPDIVVGKEIESRTWVIAADSVDMSIRSQASEFRELININYLPS